MAKLSTGQRAALPQSEFALPGRRFPLNDPNHDRAALSMAPRAYKAGSISLSQLGRIRAKAKSRLGSSYQGGSAQ
jgi:hypothetical protein